MPGYQVHRDAVAHARQLIDQGRVDVDTEWSDAAPSTGDENDEIDDDSFDGYARWHLAVDPGKGEKAKARFRFPYGDFENVVRSALIHAKARGPERLQHRLTAADRRHISPEPKPSDTSVTDT